ncbi:MAG: exopolysaccharide biosynthesis protein [Alphaproteobacteria bacterium]
MHCARPLPFSQVIPNLAIMLIAFSFLEADGMLLAVSPVLAAGYL